MIPSDKLREIAFKWGCRAVSKYEDKRKECLSDLTALLEQHKEMMLREELIKYDKWLNDNDHYADNADEHAELVVNEYLECLRNVKK